jgi:predicted nucleic acid-binding protein
MIVVDAGVIVAAVCDHPHHEAAITLLEKDSNWLAPVLWRSEVRNVIGLKLCNIARLISPDEAVEAYEDALALLAHGTRPVDPLACLQTMLRYNLSGYDAEYVTLSQVEGVELVTTDRRMVNKLRAKGFHAVQLLES